MHYRDRHGSARQGNTRLVLVSDPAGVEPRRRRGRPRSDGQTGEASAKSAIIHAAEAEFADRGYEAASLRAIARRAAVDPALVHHYFEDKADLFAATIKAPVRPDKVIASILNGPRDQVGDSVVRYLIEQLGDTKARTRVVVLLRTAVGTGPAGRILKEFLVREVFLRLAAGISGDDAELRASLAASQIIGLMITRYVLALEPLASASVDDVVARVGPVVQWHLVGFGSPAALIASRSLDAGALEGE